MRKSWRCWCNCLNMNECGMAFHRPRKGESLARLIRRIPQTCRPDRPSSVSPRSRQWKDAKEVLVDQSDKELLAIVALGKNQGYLTYDEVNAYLPDEAVSPEKL